MFLSRKKENIVDCRMVPLADKLFSNVFSGKTFVKCQKRWRGATETNKYKSINLSKNFAWESILILFKTSSKVSKMPKCLKLRPTQLICFNTFHFVTEADVEMRATRKVGSSGSVCPLHVIVSENESESWVVKLRVGNENEIEVLAWKTLPKEQQGLF